LVGTVSIVRAEVAIHELNRYGLRLVRWRGDLLQSQRRGEALLTLPGVQFLGNRKPRLIGVVHIAGALVAIFLVWWMLRMYVL